MKVVEARFPSLWIDTTTTLSAKAASDLVIAGISGAIRYLGALRPDERDAILASGLDLMAVTYSREPGWIPSGQLGRDDGVADVAHLQLAGLPLGCTVWIDLEGVVGSASSTAAWVNARATVLRDNGFDAGLYVGAPQPLMAHQLYAIPEIDRYWAAFNEGIPSPDCGFCLRQLFPPDIILEGVQVDIDVVQADYKRRLPMVISA